MDKYMYTALALWAQLTEALSEHLEDRRRGQGFVEYAFILLFVAVALTVALVAFRGGIASLFTRITTCLEGSPSSACS
jgi:Flp pilus assembly pilin Flp